MSCIQVKQTGRFPASSFSSSLHSLINSDVILGFCRALMADKLSEYTGSSAKTNVLSIKAHSNIAYVSAWKTLAYYLRGMYKSSSTPLKKIPEPSCLPHQGDLRRQDDLRQGSLRRRMLTSSPEPPETERSRISYLQTSTKVFPKTSIKPNSYLVERQRISMPL